MSGAEKRRKILRTLAELATVSGFIFTILTFSYRLGESSSEGNFEQIRQEISSLNTQLHEQKSSVVTAQSEIESMRDYYFDLEKYFQRSLSGSREELMISNSNTRIAFYEYFKSICERNPDQGEIEACGDMMRGFLGCIAEAEKSEDGVDDDGNPIITVVELDSFGLDQCLDAL